MSYSVGQVAGFAGITVRTLHHYGEIGLLVSGERTYAGHRRYTDADLDRLQQILFHRELGFPLEEIAALLDDPDADPRAHLRRQHELLTARIEKLQKMAAAVEHAMEARTMGINLTPKERFEVGDKDPEQYREEAEQRWGGTEAYAESQRRAARYRTLAQCSTLQGGGGGHPARSGPKGRSGMAKIALSDDGVIGPTAGRAGSQACGGRVRPTLTGRQWPVKQEPEVVSRSGTDRNLLPSGGEDVKPRRTGSIQAEAGDWQERYAALVAATPRDRPRPRRPRGSPPRRDRRRAVGAHLAPAAMSQREVSSSLSHSFLPVIPRRVLEPPGERGAVASR